MECLQNQTIRKIGVFEEKAQMLKENGEVGGSLNASIVRFTSPGSTRLCSSFLNHKPPLGFIKFKKKNVNELIKWSKYIVLREMGLI